MVAWNIWITNKKIEIYKGKPVHLCCGAPPFITSMLFASTQPSVLAFSCAYKRLAILFKGYFPCSKAITMWHSKILFSIVWWLHLPWLFLSHLSSWPLLIFFFFFFSYAVANFIQSTRQFLLWGLRKITWVKFSRVQAACNYKAMPLVAKTHFPIEAHEYLIE